jgi:hypothetical protein
MQEQMKIVLEPALLRGCVGHEDEDWLKATWPGTFGTLLARLQQSPLLGASFGPPSASLAVSSCGKGRLHAAWPRRPFGTA